MTSEHTTQHTPSDMSSDVSTEHPLTTAEDALEELAYAAYMAIVACPNMSGCITATIEQISELQTQLDTETLTTNGLSEHLQTAREKLTALKRIILRGEDAADEAESIINRLAKKVRAANLQREQNEGDN